MLILAFFASSEPYDKITLKTILDEYTFHFMGGMRSFREPLPFKLAWRTSCMGSKA